MHWGICLDVSAFYAGALAQLGERLICIQEVRSSILLGSTSFAGKATGCYVFAQQILSHSIFWPLAKNRGSVAQVVRAHA